MDAVAITIYAIVGAIGGFLHWIIPVKGDKPDNLIELIKRIVAGLILVPIVFVSADQLTGIYPALKAFMNLGYLGAVFVGYFAIDIWKMFRDFFQERKSAQ